MSKGLESIILSKVDFSHDERIMIMTMLGHYLANPSVEDEARLIFKKLFFDGETEALKQYKDRLISVKNKLLKGDYALSFREMSDTSTMILKYLMLGYENDNVLVKNILDKMSEKEINLAEEISIRQEKGTK